MNFIRKVALSPSLMPTSSLLRSLNLSHPELQLRFFAQKTNPTNPYAGLKSKIAEGEKQVMECFESDVEVRIKFYLIIFKLVTLINYYYFRATVTLKT